MRNNYAAALCDAPGATLDDLREAGRRSRKRTDPRRVFGGAHPSRAWRGRNTRERRRETRRASWTRAPISHTASKPPRSPAGRTATAQRQQQPGQAGCARGGATPPYLRIWRNLQAAPKTVNAVADRASRGSARRTRCPTETQLVATATITFVSSNPSVRPISSRSPAKMGDAQSQQVVVIT